ncbi:MAG: hypothetical protein HQL69_17780 [Magnetococcales bacterium]|nr:hypothetical protein [Magnetococcales bacterium]
MFVSIKNHSKRKRNRLENRGRSWAGKPSILKNQQVNRRNKKAVWSGAKAAEPKSNLRSGDSWGTQSYGGEWRTRFLEGGFVVASGLSNMIKSGIDNIFNWFQGGRQAVENAVSQPLRSNFFDDGGDISADRVEPELDPGYDVTQSGYWQQDLEETHIVESHVTPGEFLPLANEQQAASSANFRDSIEWNKMDSQDQEESGLDQGELEDQAGALRSMFSNHNSNS